MCVTALLCFKHDYIVVLLQATNRHDDPMTCITDTSSAVPMTMKGFTVPDCVFTAADIQAAYLVPYG